MEEQVNYTLIGLFVLVLSTALIGGVLWLASGKSYRTVYDGYQVYMQESVAGLNLNAPVRYRGVEVGRVQAITLAPDNVEQVQLTLGIVHGTPIKTDTVAILQSHGLTGLTFVELSGGSREADNLKAADARHLPVIKTGPSLMMRLDSSLTTLLANLNRSSERINALLDDENRLAIKHTLSDLALLSHTLARRQPEIDAGIGHASRTLDGVARLSAELPALIEHLNRSADSLEHMGQEVGLAAASTRTAMDDTRQLSNDTLPQVQQLLQELRELTSSMQRLSDELEQNPSMLLHGKGANQPGPGE